jgi:hypothetical protein
VPAGSTAGYNITFALDNETTSSGVSTGSFIQGSTAIPATYNAANESTYVKMRKFQFGFQGGFDGWSPSRPKKIGSDITPENTAGLDCTNASSDGTVAYKRAFSILSNDDEYDFRVIALTIW